MLEKCVLPYNKLIQWRKKMNENYVNLYKIITLNLQLYLFFTKFIIYALNLLKFIQKIKKYFLFYNI